MFTKFTKHFSQTQNSVIDEIDKFQKQIHGTSMTVLALMEIGILPKDDMAKQKALLTHENQLRYQRHLEWHDSRRSYQ